MLFVPVLKMAMDSDPHACKISMLWNWYTIDTCFIAKSWHVTSRGMFAGSCIGVFFFVFACQWLSRISKEFDAVLASNYDPNTSQNNFNSQVNPLIHSVSHKWLVKPDTAVPLHYHLIKTLLYTLEWGASYLIMLLFMYYNGYIIISCILGAFFGKLVFGYNEPFTFDVNCCKQ